MSQPDPRTPPEARTSPEALNQAEQQQLIQEIGRLVLRALPPGWAEASIEYRAVGSHQETSAQLLTPNGTVVPISAPLEVQTLFDRLRMGMNQPDRGTWLSALYRLQRPSSYSVDFNADYEPAWRTPPAPTEFAEELRHHPRNPVNIPEWLARRAEMGVAAAPELGTPPPATVDLRTAEVFDGVDADGRPTVDRPGIPDEELDRLQDYLERAPVVFAGRGYDADLIAPDGSRTVPLTFHTDGQWVWPGAVAYYLRWHQVPPEHDLVAHIRQMGFRIPEIDERTGQQAASLASGLPQGATSRAG